MDRPGFEPGILPRAKGMLVQLSYQPVVIDSRSWDRTSSLRYVRPALSRLSYPRVNEKASEGSRTPVASLEDWCLDRSATEAEFPAGESNSALWVKSPVHHAPMLARDESAREESNLRDPAYQAGACTRTQLRAGNQVGRARTTSSGSTTPRSTG